MTTNVEELAETALPLAERIWQAAEQAGTYVAQQAVEHGPAAVDLAFAVVRIEALSELIFAPIFLGIGVTSYKVGRFLHREGKKNLNKWGNFQDSYAAGFALSICGTILGATLGLYFLSRVWAWVGLFYPEVWLAHAALEKLL